MSSGCESVRRRLLLSSAQEFHGRIAFKQRFCTTALYQPIISSASQCGREMVVEKGRGERKGRRGGGNLCNKTKRVTYDARPALRSLTLLLLYFVKQTYQRKSHCLLHRTFAKMRDRRTDREADRQTGSISRFLCSQDDMFPGEVVGDDVFTGYV